MAVDHTSQVAPDCQSPHCNEWMVRALALENDIFCNTTGWEVRIVEMGELNIRSGCRSQVSANGGFRKGPVMMYDGDSRDRDSNDNYYRSKQNMARSASWMLASCP